MEVFKNSVLGSLSNSLLLVPVPLAKTNGKLSPAAKQPSHTETLGTQGELGELGMDTTTWKGDQFQINSDRKTKNIDPKLVCKTNILKN